MTTILLIIAVWLLAVIIFLLWWKTIMDMNHELDRMMEEELASASKIQKTC